MIRRFYINLIKRERHGFFDGMTLFLLRLASGVFFLAVLFKNFLYDKKILKIVKLPQKVISIGNLTAGGTGKTPVVRHLAGKLKQSGKNAAVICRAYSGSMKEGWINNRSVSEAGDEPAMMAKFLGGIPVGVSVDRARLARTIDNVDIFLLDDAFQHRKLHRDLDIVIIDASSDAEKKYFLPRGPYREGFDSLKRADVAVITRISRQEKEKFGKIKERIKKINGNIEIILAETRCIRNFNEKSGSIFTAIGNPEAFKKDLEEMGITINKTIFFPDHYAFKKSDLESLDENETYFVTCKDAVKIGGGRRFVAVDLEMKLFDEEMREIEWPGKLKNLLS